MPHKYTMEDYLDMKKNKIMSFIWGACVQENRKELRQYEVPSLKCIEMTITRFAGPQGSIQKKEICG